MSHRNLAEQSTKNSRSMIEGYLYTASDLLGISIDLKSLSEQVRRTINLLSDAEFTDLCNDYLPWTRKRDRYPSMEELVEASRRHGVVSFSEMSLSNGQTGVVVTNHQGLNRGTSQHVFDGDQVTYNLVKIENLIQRQEGQIIQVVQFPILSVYFGTPIFEAPKVNSIVRGNEYTSVFPIAVKDTFIPT